MKKNFLSIAMAALFFTTASFAQQITKFAVVDTNKVYQAYFRNSAPVRNYETKKEAMEAGRRMSINQGTELIPHRKDGTIQNPNSHGNDPCPPRDKK